MLAMKPRAKFGLYHNRWNFLVESEILVIIVYINDVQVIHAFNCIIQQYCEKRMIVE